MYTIPSAATSSRHLAYLPVGFDFYLHSYNRYTTRYGIYLRDMSNYKFNGSLVPIMDMLDLGERDEK